MAFQQLYYTSCEHGLGGYGGYQFNAVTPGISPVVLREVEERTVYEPPQWLLTEPALDEPEAYPVAFSYGTSEAAGTVIAAQVVFTGTDYSGRPGNYFVHALASRAPEEDFGPLLPAELWGAALWQSRPVSHTELPELAAPPPRGDIDRPGVQAFLDARGAQEILPELLTAVGQAMAGEWPVVVVSRDATENAWWIAAVSYLLGEQLGRQLTFTTYSHRPGYARYHVIGVLPGTLPPDAGESFRVFDFAARRTPRAGIHPLAAILVGTGVMAASGLWQQATVFASGTETTLDDWLAPVAMAAGLLGRRLSFAEADAVARWLPAAADRMPAQLTDVGLGVALTQPQDALADERLDELLSVARRLAIPVRVEQLERLLVGRAAEHIARGQPARTFRLVSPAVQTARDQAIEILATATPGTAIAVLTWTAGCAVVLPDTELERYGRIRLDPATPQHQLTRLLSSQPAVLRGFLERLASEPAEVTKTVLSGPVSDKLRRDDLADHPELAELWLVQSAARGRRKPLRAFDEIVDIRAAAQRSPLVDATLLRLLWPEGCPPEELTELLGIVADPPGPGILDWFAAEISSVSTRGTTSDDWIRLALALTDHPFLSLLPEPETRSIRRAVRTLPLLKRAYRDGPRGDATVFAELFAQYAEADHDTRRMLEHELPSLLAQASPLGEALRGCPPAVAASLGQALTDRLMPSPADITLARRVFSALNHQEVYATPTLSEPLTTAFEQVRGWRRHDLGALAQTWDKDSETARSFRLWRDANRGALARRFRGGADPPGQRP